MSVKGMIAAVSAALAVAGGAAVAVTLPARGNGTMRPKLRRAVQRRFRLELPHRLVQAGSDFTIAGQGLVSAFYANGLVDQHYGGDAAYEVQYSPFGAPTGQCVGVAATATAGEKVTLQPCSVSSKTIWIADSAASVTHSFVPLINGSDTNFSNPFVLTYPAGSSPDDLPRPQLEVDNLPGGQVPGNQLWTALGDILGGVLSIAQPANITTDATGPSGATVTYPLPAVTDPDATSPPAAVCTPPSGSVFPIGTTTVTCTVTEPAGAALMHSSQRTHSSRFCLTIRSPSGPAAKMSTGQTSASLRASSASPATAASTVTSMNVPGIS